MGYMDVLFFVVMFFSYLYGVFFGEFDFGNFNAQFLIYNLLLKYS